MEEQFLPVTIISRLGTIPGFANTEVAWFDYYDARFRKANRSYVMLLESVKLMYEPWDWHDRWYIDLVAIRWVDA